MKRCSDNRKIKLAALATVAGLTVHSSVATAVDFTWDGNSGTDLFFDNPLNWTANSGIPDDSADQVRFTSSSPEPSTINLRRNEVAGWFGASTTGRSATFNLNGFQLDFTSSTPTDLNHSSTSSNTIAFAGNGTTTEGAVNAGTVNMTGQLLVTFTGGAPTVASGLPAQKTTILVSGGADLNTAGGISLGDYRSPSALTITGAGSRVNNSGQFQTNRGANYGYATMDPRSEIKILDGGVLNHDGTTQAFRMQGSNDARTTSRLLIDGAGSQFNVNVNSEASTVPLGGGDRKVTIDVTGGGLANFATALPGKFDNTGTGTVTYNISGTDGVNGSKVTALTGSIGGWSTDNITVSRIGATIINVGVGGILEARGRDGSDRSFAIFDTSTLSLQGGTVQMTGTGGTNNLIVRNITTGKARLEGFGTITGGHVIAEGDSIVSPGLSAGTIKITDGSFTTAGGATATDLLWELQTSSGNPHDLVAVTGAGESVTIGNGSADDITFSVLGGGLLASGGEGFMDFLIGETVNYGGAVLNADIPDVDNLDDLLDAAGYTRTSGTPGPGQYRYFLTEVGAGDYAGGEYADLQALRLELAPIPEPATIGLLALGGIGLLRRRRH